MTKSRWIALVLVLAAWRWQDPVRANLNAGFAKGPQYVAEAVPGNGPIKDGLQFSLDSPKAIFRSDERVEVTLHLKNVADRTRPTIWRLVPWYHQFTLAVTDVSGRAVPRTLDRFERDPTVLSYGISIAQINIDPGKELRVGLADLRDYFPLVAGQAYFVTAELTEANSDKTGVVQLISNTVKVRLGAGPREPGLSLGEALAGGGDVEDGVQLLIDSTKHRFRVGEAVNIVMHLKNLRATPMADGWSGGPWFWYGNNVILKVVDDTGAAVDRKFDGVENELPANRPETSSNEFQIPVGQELRIPLPDLRKYFALAAGGTYHVTASCGARPTEGQNGITLTSNTIEVTLSEP